MPPPTRRRVGSPPARRGARWLLVALAAAIALLVGGAAPASAHASLVGSDPDDGAVLAQAPAVVTLRFDEPVDVVPGAVRLRLPSGEAVQLDAEADAGGRAVTADLPGALAERLRGTVALSWRVVSDDGHPLAGVLVFSVGAASGGVSAADLLPDGGAVPVVQALMHGVGYAALLLAGGLTLFLVWTTRATRLPAPIRARLRRVLGIAAGVAIGAWAIAVPLAGAYRIGLGLGEIVDPAVLDPDLVGSDVLVLGLVALGLVAALWSTRRDPAAARPPAQLSVQPSVPLGVAAAAGVWAPALVGHTRAYEPSALLVLTDALHLTAGAAWFGGLVGLALALPALAGRPRDAATLLSAFSSLAAGLLLAVAITGTLQGWRILGSWHLLASDTYGRLLLVKVALAGIVALVAAHNRWRLLPAVLADDGHAARRAAAQRVGRAVAVEAVVLVALLGVTGFLTQAAPEGDAVPGGAPTARR